MQLSGCTAFIVVSRDQSHRALKAEGKSLRAHRVPQPPLEKGRSPASAICSHTVCCNAPSEFKAPSSPEA